MTLAAFVFYFAIRKWSSRSFWLHLVLLSLVIAAFLILRFYPMIVDPQGLSGALSKMAGSETGKDLLGYFINFRHPIIAPILTSLFPLKVIDGGWHPAVFLGYVPLLLIALAIARSKARRRVIPWMLLVMPFLILRLGSFLSVNGTHFRSIILPKYYLAEAFPYLFRPFWATDNFHAGALFPIAVLACYGLLSLLQIVPPRRRLSVILVLAGAVAFEYYQRPTEKIIPEGRLAFIDWLLQEEDQDAIHLINLPFGGGYSKYYGFYQTYTGYPHVEGRPTRTPPIAFDFINRNLLLSTWRAGKIINCLPDNYGEFINAQNQLLADGFTHIILHRDLIGGQSTPHNFFNTPRSYQDEFASIYLVEDLLRNCDVPALLSKAAQTNVERAKESVVFPRNGSSILSIQHYSAGDDEARQSYSAVLYNMRGFVPLDDNDISEASAPNSNSLEYGPNTTLAANSAILFAYDPQSAAPALIESYRRWVSHQFNSCGLVSSTANSEIEYFLRMGYSCDLAITDDPFEIHYDNNIQLGNLLPIQNENALDLYFLWKRLPEDSYSFSIQFFDADDNKALGQDFVIGLEPLAHHRIDFSALDPGDYQVKLIVYNFETRVSVPGTVISADAHFDRELEIMRLTIK